MSREAMEHSIRGGRARSARQESEAREESGPADERSWPADRYIDPEQVEELLTIGEVSQRTGVAASALHYYEELGMISATRTAGNQRRYHRHMIRRVTLITVAKNLGMPLADVRQALAEVPLDATPSHADWQRASRRWKQVLAQRRLAIERLERELTGCIGCGCLSMKACRLLNPDDALGQHGSGARRLAEPGDSGTSLR